MHDFSMLLLMNWLPVGMAMIAFFSVGFLLAKFVQGRRPTRLFRAFEENLNLVSKWSALGTSQHDLLKKLHWRWQADRDEWEARILEGETELAARELRINELTAQLENPGESAPATIILDRSVERKVRWLEARLRNKEREIDNHEAAAAQASQVHQQLRALLNWKNQEAVVLHSGGASLQVVPSDGEEPPEPLETILVLGKRRDKEQGGNTNRAGIEALRTELRAKDEETNQLTRQLEEAHEELEYGAASLEEQKTAVREREKRLEKNESEIISKTATIDFLESEVARLKESTEGRDPVKGSKAELKVELNDTRHEISDAHTCEIVLLKARLKKLNGSEEERERLDHELDVSRQELASLRSRFDGAKGDLTSAVGQMEELEAIIEDRNAEVDDLSSEVRQQRNGIQKLKGQLAEKEGELDAASGEVQTLSEQVSKKDASMVIKVRRINNLERSLRERYEEINSVRTGYDEELKTARYHAARAGQLAAELDRRASVFDQISVRAVISEEELEKADHRVKELSAKLAKSKESITQLEGDVERLSKEKRDQTQAIEDSEALIGKLEEGARRKEKQCEGLTIDLDQSRKEIDTQRERSEEKFRRLAQENGKEVTRLEKDTSDLTLRIRKLTVGLEAAERHRESLEITSAELKETLKTNDGRILALISSLEDKKTEIENLKSSLANLENEFCASEAGLKKAREKAESTQRELEVRLEATITESAIVTGAKEEKVRKQFAEIEALKNKLLNQQNDLENHEKIRQQGIEEVETYRINLAERGDVIHELRSEINNILLQRSSRDNEISHLKEKLREVESCLRAPDKTAAPQSVKTSSKEGIEGSEQRIQRSPLGEARKQGDVSLEESDLPAKSKTNREALVLEVSEGANTYEVSEEREPIDGNSVFFDESSADLDEKSLAKIDQFAKAVRGSNQLVTVAVIGFAGAEGTVDYNESLSARRADIVRERLLERGVPQALISVKISGHDLRSIDWRARRVEFLQIAQPVAETLN